MVFFAAAVVKAAVAVKKEAKKQSIRHSMIAAPGAQPDGFAAGQGGNGSTVSIAPDWWGGDGGSYALASPSNAGSSADDASQASSARHGAGASVHGPADVPSISADSLHVPAAVRMHAEVAGDGALSPKTSDDDEARDEPAERVRTATPPAGSPAAALQRRNSARRDASSVQPGSFRAQLRHVQSARTAKVTTMDSLVDPTSELTVSSSRPGKRPVPAPTKGSFAASMSRKPSASASISSRRSVPSPPKGSFSALAGTAAAPPGTRSSQGAVPAAAKGSFSASNAKGTLSADIAPTSRPKARPRSQPIPKSDPASAPTPLVKRQSKPARGSFRDAAASGKVPVGPPRIPAPGALQRKASNFNNPFAS